MTYDSKTAEDEARALGFIDPPQHDRHIYDWLMGRAEELERKIEAAARAREEADR